MKVLIYCYTKMLIYPYEHKHFDYDFKDIHSYVFYDVSNFKEADDIVKKLTDSQENNFNKFDWEIHCVRNQYSSKTNDELRELYTKLGNEEFVKRCCIA